jgi:hypothetical protein
MHCLYLSYDIESGQNVFFAVNVYKLFADVIRIIQNIYYKDVYNN